jgi:REP element-mobilizing transposase RayT
MGDDPLAYFLTWTAYGTWLPGDERGWVAKPGVFRLPDPDLEAAALPLMTEPALILDNEQRRIVEQTVADHCRIRHWHLHVVNARTKHIHAVVTAPRRKPKDVMDQFKAWCTRKLKEHLLKTCGEAVNLKPEAQAKDSAATLMVRENWWTQGGSKRQLFTDTALENAILYVRDCQD